MTPVCRRMAKLTAELVTKLEVEARRWTPDQPVDIEMRPAELLELCAAWRALLQVRAVVHAHTQPSYEAYIYTPLLEQALAPPQPGDEDHSI